MRGKAAGAKLPGEVIDTERPNRRSLSALRFRHRAFSERMNYPIG
jgi:hypothetical protein